jgi:signal transduction histidine kinase
MAMFDDKHNMNKLWASSLKNYSLAVLIHHMVGNELAIISGYTQLLLREEAMQEKDLYLLDSKELAQHHEKRASYLRIMKQSEEYLNNFLIQLRDCSLATTKRRFNECMERTDVVSLCRQIVEKLMPFYKDYPPQTLFPSQPLYVICNRIWITLALDTIVNHTIAARTASTPVIIGVEEYTDPSHDLQEAKIGIHITRGVMEQKSGTEGIFEMWSQMHEESGQDVCVALSDGILREHGGRLWSEQEAEQREAVYAALPLVK